MPTLVQIEATKKRVKEVFSLFEFEASALPYLLSQSRAGV